MTDLPNGARTLHQGIAATSLVTSDGATALIADHGAHLLSWIPAGGREALFLSPASRYGDQSAIRGGVPIIFPQFAERGNGRRHGFARLQAWEPITVGIDATGAATARWRLQGVFGASAGNDLDGSYCLTFDVRLHADTIELCLTIANPGATAWHCNAALHTYLAVDALAASTVEGLSGQAYIDKTNPDTATTVDVAPQIRFESEIDRIYLTAPWRVQLQQPGRRIIVERDGFSDTVVWNPGAEKAAALDDLQKDGFRGFVCIEAAEIGQPISLAPRASWYGTQKLSVKTI